MIRGGVDVEDGGGAIPNVSVAQTGNSVVIQLLDPFGWFVDSASQPDFKRGVVVIVFDVS